MKNTAISCVFLICVGLLGGCATAEKSRDEKLYSGKIEDVLAEATAASNAGKTDKAAAILKTAANSFPAEKSPWLQLAQMQFDSANYGEAITSAQEALQRDPHDRLASSIIAVSGLRLSTKALADLSRQNNLSGSLKTEAQDLAKLLRETIGEPVLVPARPRPVAQAKPVRGTPVAGGKAPVGVTAKSGSEGGDSNPFGALK